MVKTYAFNKKYNATSHKVLFQCEILRAKFLCTHYFLTDNFNFIYARKLLLASKKKLDFHVFLAKKYVFIWSSRWHGQNRSGSSIPVLFAPTH